MGERIADSIAHIYSKFKKYCKFRECNGKYAEILKNYIEILHTKHPLRADMDYLENEYIISQNVVDNYESMKELISIINSEDYLYLSDNEEIREMYIIAKEICSDLYNRRNNIAR